MSDELKRDHQEKLGEKFGAIFNGVSWRCCTNRHGPARCPPTGSSPADAI